jgi:hypothetical protein
MSIVSVVEDVGSMPLPPFSGRRWMMMPFRLEDVCGTVPDSMWHYTVSRLVELGGCESGVGYLTIDEAEVQPGETHRRPGLHVDGVGPDGRLGGWGGGGGYASSGMVVASSHTGCRAWGGIIDAWPGPNGDCEHMRGLLRDEDAIDLRGGRAYRLNPSAVHEAIPLQRVTHRQFVRLSLPSDAPWYEGYTRNPTGVQPTGPIHGPRTEFMAFRPGAQ